MDIISLELSRRLGQSADAVLLGTVELIEQLQTLIRGIGLHAIEGKPEDFAQLQRDIAGIAGELKSESSTDDLLLAISKTLQSMEEYNRRAGVLFKAQVEELRAMLGTMAETVQFIVSSSETSVKQLTFVESQLQRASTLEDLRQLKTYTNACLNLVRRESTRLQDESKNRVEALKKSVELLAVRLKAAAVEDSEDPVTGLPGRAAAEQAIEDKVAGGKPFMVALFLMDRLESINAKFGHPVGDEVIAGCAHMLAKNLPGAGLYRWSGPGFLAIFDPLISLPEAEKRARQASAQTLQRNIESDGRMLMVVMGVSCHVQQISSKTMPDELFRKMDSFMVAAQG